MHAFFSEPRSYHSLQWAETLATRPQLQPKFFVELPSRLNQLVIKFGTS
jgi:hypothetical protein